MMFSKAFKVGIVVGLLGLTGCASFNTPPTQKEQERRIREWNLPMPNPWNYDYTARPTGQ